MTRATIRTLTPDDFDGALILYNHLTDGPSLADTSQARATFAQIITHAGSQICGAFVQEQLVSMATLHILPNMTMDQKSYCVIENVVTDPGFRNLGLGRRVLDHLRDHAWDQGAYKIMIMTGRARGAKVFYEKAGYSGDGKYGMVLRKDAVGNTSDMTL